MIVFFEHVLKIAHLLEQNYVDNPDHIKFQDPRAGKCNIGNIIVKIWTFLYILDKKGPSF